MYQSHCKDQFELYIFYLMFLNNYLRSHKIRDTCYDENVNI